MADKDVLLDLSTERRREKIAIDGKLYELAAMQDFQLQEYQWLAEQGRIVQKMSEATPITSTDLANIANMLDKVLNKIMRTRLPRRVIRRLSNNQKISIMAAFTKAAGIKEATPRPTLQDGMSSSPASSDSMAAQ